MQTFKIPEPNVERFKDKIAKLAKVAVKLGLPPISCTFVETVTERHLYESFYRNYSLFTIEGENPKFAGWSFLASVESSEFGNLIRKASDAEMSAHWQLAVMTCEHCQKKRARKAYYILKHDDRREISVGASCIKDFLGHKDPKQIGTWMETWLSLSEEQEESFGGGGLYESPVWELKDLIETALTCIRKDGFMSRKKALEFGLYRTTSSDMLNYLVPPSKSSKDYENELLAWQAFREARPIGDYERELAPLIIAWMLGLEHRSNRNEFQMNLCIFAKTNFISSKDFGFIAAAAFIGGNELEKIKIEKLKLAAKSNEWMGTIGERVKNIELTLVKMRTIFSDYGESILYMFEDAAGNSYKWFSSRDAGLHLEARYNVSGTIKKHDDYEGRRQTMLSRCKCKALDFSLDEKSIVALHAR